MAKIGIVLAGGFAKGAYQVGVLKAIREFFSPDDVVCISASSIGSLNAYAFLQDKLDVAERMWGSSDFKGFKAFTTQYLSGKFITGVIDDLVRDAVHPINSFYITCFNYSRLALDYINLKNAEPEQVRDFLRAGVAMPMFVRAVKVNGQRYADGGLIDNIPVKPMVKYPIDYAIVVHFDNGNVVFDNEEFDKKLIKINFIDDRFIKNSFSFDKDSIAYMLQAGYDRSKALLDKIFAHGTDDLPFIYKKAAQLNARHGARKTRFTGDVVVGNINKLMKKLISCNDPDMNKS